MRVARLDLFHGRVDDFHAVKREGAARRSNSYRAKLRGKALHRAFLIDWEEVRRRRK